VDHHVIPQGDDHATPRVRSVFFFCTPAFGWLSSPICWLFSLTRCKTPAGSGRRASAQPCLMGRATRCVEPMAASASAAAIACWSPRHLLTVELTYFWGLAGTGMNRRSIIVGVRLESFRMEVPCDKSCDNSWPNEVSTATLGLSTGGSSVQRKHETAGQRGYDLRWEWWPGAGSNRRPSDFQSDARTN
jgi:hypothetical protein